jgi:hypothetical protein
MTPPYGTLTALLKKAEAVAEKVLEIASCGRGEVRVCVKTRATALLKNAADGG